MVKRNALLPIFEAAFAWRQDEDVFNDVKASLDDFLAEMDTLLNDTRPSAEHIALFPKVYATIMAGRYCGNSDRECDIISGYLNQLGLSDPMKKILHLVELNGPASSEGGIKLSIESFARRIVFSIFEIETYAFCRQVYNNESVVRYCPRITGLQQPLKP